MRLLPFLKILVPHSVLTSVLSLVVGSLMASNGFKFIFIIIFSALTYGICVGAFNTLNCIFDVASDRISKPRRPLPSLEMKMRVAFIYYALLVITSLVFAYFLNFYLMIFCITVFIFSILYSVPPLRLKEKIFLNTFIVSIIFIFLPILSGWLLFSSITTFPWHISIILTIISYLMIMTKDIQDTTADKVYSVRTITNIFGIYRTGKILKKWIFFPYILTVILIIMQILKPIYVITLIPLLGGIYLSISIERNPRENQGSKFLIEAILIGLSTEFLFLVSFLLE